MCAASRANDEIGLPPASRSITVPSPYRSEWHCCRNRAPKPRANKLDARCTGNVSVVLDSFSKLCNLQIGASNFYLNHRIHFLFSAYQSNLMS